MSESPVVVGTDLSEAADEAVRQASAWAKRRNAPLVVVHVTSIATFQSLETPKVVAALGEKLAALTEQNAELAMETGTAHAGLIELAEHRGAQLLVVGGSGAGLTGSLFGSTAEQTIRYATCPVLVARRSTSDGPVLAATDFSDASLPAVGAAHDEAALRGAALVVLHSIHAPPSPLAALGPMIFSAPRPTQADLDAVRQAASQTLATLVEAQHPLAEALLTEGPPADAIVGAARSRSAALVVVGTHGRTGLRRFALGSVAERVARSAPCSVLAVRLAE